MSTARIDVVNHNIGGGGTYGTHLYTDGTAQIGSVLRVVQDYDDDPTTRIDAITLQEVYESHFEWWRNHNGWYGVFVPMTDGFENPIPERKGQAVLSRYPVLDSHIEPLGVGGLVATGKEFNLLCVSFDHPGFTGADNLWICTTHLWAQGHDPNGVLYSAATNDAVRDAQAEKIADYLNPRVGYARKYILTGDFNTSPKTTTIDYLHRVNRNGTIGTAKFWEADQSQDNIHGAGNLGRGGRDTVTGRKIDYWFASYSGTADAHEAGIDMTLHTASPNGGVPHEEVMRGWVKWTDIV